MADVVVTVPKGMWAAWLAEGELPGQESWPCFFCNAGDGGHCEVCDGTGTGRPGLSEWDFYLGGNPPRVFRGERVYVVAHGRLRGYAPLVAVGRTPRGFSLVRGGDAEALTIEEPIRGFQGWRYRWWDRALERPFLDFATAGVS